MNVGELDESWLSETNEYWDFPLTQWVRNTENGIVDENWQLGNWHSWMKIGNGMTAGIDLLTIGV